MNSPTPLRRQGAHRTRNSVAGALLPSLLAVVAVAALITSLAVWRAGDPAQPSAAASTGSASASSKAASSHQASTTPARSTSTPSASTPGATTPSASAPAAARTDVEVVVLNQSSRAGLASTVADQLRGKGWTVPAVGNFRGVVPATTVYYPPGAESAAQAAAEDLASPPRIRPRFGNLSTTRLTVVVTSDYPG